MSQNYMCVCLAHRIGQPRPRGRGHRPRSSPQRPPQPSLGPHSGPRGMAPAGSTGSSRGQGAQGAPVLGFLGSWPLCSDALGELPVKARLPGRCASLKRDIGPSGIGPFYLRNDTGLDTTSQRDGEIKRLLLNNVRTVQRCGLMRMRGW